MTNWLLAYLCAVVTVIGVVVSVELHRSAHFRPRSLRLQRGYALATTELAIRSRNRVGPVAVRRNLQEPDGEHNGGEPDLLHDLTVRTGPDVLYEIELVD